MRTWAALSWMALLAACGDGGAAGDVDAEPGGVASSSGAGAGSSSSGGAAVDPCASAPAAGDFEWSVTVGDRERTFLVHVPARTAAQPTPLVLDFHGRDSTAAQEDFVSAMNAKADAEGFVSVHPQGYQNTWNTGACCGAAESAQLDEVGFTTALLDELQRRLCVDEKRVYATGLSNGAMMSYLLACQLSERIAAAAPVAGSMEVLLQEPCEPSRPVSVLAFNGTADPLVQYDGVVQSVPAGVKGWAERDGCADTTQQTFQNGDTTCVSYDGCQAGAEVTLCTIDGGGHQWPGSAITLPGLGNNTQAIDATDAMWTFFAGHPRP